MIKHFKIENYKTTLSLLLSLGVLNSSPTLAGPLESGMNQLSFQLAHQVNSQENFMIAGPSVHMALGLAYLGTGTGSVTQTEMKKVLGIENYSSNEDLIRDYSILKNGFKQAGARSERNENPTIRIANQLIVEKNSLKSSFQKQVNQLGISPFLMDFSQSQQVIEKVNHWVSEATYGKIPKIITELDPNELLVLLNAMYFKGKWSIGFHKSDTDANGDFHLLNGSTKRVAMMNHQYYSSAYFQDPKTQTAIIELSYRGEEIQAPNSNYQQRFGMYFVLPQSNATFEETLKNFDQRQLESFISQMKPVYGRIYLPRFKIENQFTLQSILADLGMKSAMSTSTADFSELTSQSSAISRVIHKTFIEVDEEGTEAAAATAVVYNLESAIFYPEPDFEFIADRPFIFFIRDDLTGTVLFQGVVRNP